MAGVNAPEHNFLRTSWRW